MQGKLVKDAKGNWFREMEKGDGSFDYLPVSDVELHEAQLKPDSHLPFFQKEGKQKLKRMDALTKQLEQMVPERIDPGSGVNTRTIKDEEFFELEKEYQVAVLKGEQQHCRYQPVAAYAHKITRARPLFKGEVGVLGNQILTLEQGYGTGNFVQVSAQLESGDSK